MFGAIEYKNGIIKKIHNCSFPEGLYKKKDMLDDYVYPLFGKLKTDKKECAGYLWNTLILRERLLTINIENQLCLMEDEVVLLQLLLCSSTIYVCNKYLYNYDKSDRNSLSRKKGYWNNYWNEIMKIYDAKIAIGKATTLNINEYQKRLNTFLAHNYLRSISNETYFDNPNNLYKRIMNIYKMNSRKVNNELRHYQRKDFKFIEKILLWLALHKLSIIVYFYYLIKYDQMRKFFKERNKYD